MEDFEEKHRNFCQKSEEKRKMKGGSKAREEERMKNLEEGLEKVLKLEQSEEAKKQMVELSEVCRKQEEEKAKSKSEGGKSKRGRGKK